MWPLVHRDQAGAGRFALLLQQLGLHLGDEFDLLALRAAKYLSSPRCRKESAAPRTAKAARLVRVK